MKLRSVKKAFLQQIEASGRTLKTLSPADGIDLMLHFYQRERIEGCFVEQDGDMLLYQWGTYDWGEGEWFECNITRQLIKSAGEDETIRQLLLTFKFKPTQELRNLGEGTRWCYSLDESEEFRNFIAQSAAFKEVTKVPLIEVRLDFEVAD